MSSDPDRERREYAVKAVVASTAATLLPFTLLFFAFYLFGVFRLTDLLIVLGADCVVGFCLLLSRRAWEASAWIQSALFVVLPVRMAWAQGGWTPATVYISLAVVLGMTLLEVRAAWGLMAVSLLLYIGASWAHGNLGLLVLLNILLTVAAPLCGIVVLLRFTLRQLGGALEKSRITADGLTREIGERTRAESALTASMQTIRALFESMPDGIVVMDAGGRITDCNAASARMFEVDARGEVVGRNIIDFVVSDDRSRAQQKLVQLMREGPNGRSLRLRVQGTRGRSFDAFVNGSLHLDAEGMMQGLVISVRDITDMLRLESQLRQAQKMEAVGQLAGGVAHDFNNLLLGIQGYTDLALHSMEAAHAAREPLEQVLKASERAGAIVRQLLAFSRRETPSPVVLRLNDVIEGFLKMLGRLIGEHVTVRLDLAADLGNVVADPGQVEQVLVNLCLNSRDAMPDGGTITIETENATLDAAFAATHPGARPGQFVCLRVTDEGEGMSADAMAHLFEPFFTTKRPGRGTGMGLATVYSIVTRHGALIDCASAPGRGTRFCLYFPRTDASPVQAAPDGIPREADTGTETLLVVEDDEMVRSLAQRILCDAGYTVLPACGGEEALELFRRRGADVALALIDVVMPGMNGRLVAQALHEMQPSLPILFSSGYDFHMLDDASFPSGPRAEIIHKPYRARDLLRRVHDALHGTPGAAPPLS